jgi:salicylate hydroxylase
MIDGFDSLFRWALMHRAPMARWGEGCVTLLGDACHSMMPMLAQGACQALEDGVVVARCLEKYADAAEAFRHYETARRERAHRAVAGSAENAKRFHNQTLADAAQAEAYVTREWQPDKIKARYDWLFEYNASSVPI